MRPLLSFALIAGLALIPSGGFADDAKSVEQLVVEMADTPSDHAAVAAHFREKAERARAAAKRHESMGRSYGGGKLGTRAQLADHCKRLAAQHEAMAAEYDALAKLHDELAKTAP